MRHILSVAMKSESTFDYGDGVRLISGDFEGQVGCVVAIDDSDTRLTLEFGEGTDAEVSSSQAEGLPD